MPSWKAVQCQMPGAISSIAAEATAAVRHWAETVRKLTEQPIGLYMEHVLRDRRLSFLVLTAACASLPPAILHFFGIGTYYPPTWVHFAFIAVGASIAAAAALALTIAGARRNDGRTVLLGTAFTVMTALLAVHGFATPGILVGETGVIAVAGAAVLPVGAAVLALSALPSLRRPQAVRRLLVLQVVLVTAVVSFGLVGLLAPDVLPARSPSRAARPRSP